MWIFLVCSVLISIVNSVPLPQNQPAPQAGAAVQSQPAPPGPPGPPRPPPPPSGPQTTPVPIISQTDVDNGDGNFTFGFEAGNGIRVQESGFLKPAPPAVSGRSAGPNAEAGEEESNSIQVLTGSFSYTAPDGTNISITYIADENGFQPQGDHLPTPPPIPEGVQRLLNSLPQGDASAAQISQPSRFAKSLESAPAVSATAPANIASAVTPTAPVSGAAPALTASAAASGLSASVAAPGLSASAATPAVGASAGANNPASAAATAVGTGGDAIAAASSPIVEISPLPSVES